MKRKRTFEYYGPDLRTFVDRVEGPMFQLRLPDGRWGVPMVKAYAGFLAGKGIPNPFAEMADVVEFKRAA